MPGRTDRFYKLAKSENYRSRASYKLIELQERFSLLDRKDNVLEIGSSPGGWSQVIASITSGHILSIDINPQERIEGVDFLKGNILSPSLAEKIIGYIHDNGAGCFDVILSDAMVHTSGNQSLDHARSVELCESILSLSERVLCGEGKVVVKQFQGDLTNDFIKKWKERFTRVKVSSVQASRRGSREIYIVFERRSS